MKETQYIIGEPHPDEPQLCLGCGTLVLIENSNYCCFGCTMDTPCGIHQGLNLGDLSIIRDELSKSIDRYEDSNSEEDQNYREYLIDIRTKIDLIID